MVPSRIMVPNRVLVPTRIMPCADANNGADWNNGDDVQVGAAFASAQDSFNEAPIGYTVLFSLSVALPAYLIQRSVYGGYCGSLSVADLFATLTSEPNVRVIDVRAQIELEDSGVLDLRREARGKGVALAFVQVCVTVNLLNLESKVCGRNKASVP